MPDVAAGRLNRNQTQLTMGCSGEIQQNDYRTSRDQSGEKVIFIEAKYSPSNYAQFVALGGNRPNGGYLWHFPKSAAVQKMVSDLFGDASPNVRVRIYDDEKIMKTSLAWQIGGYVIWSRKRLEDAPAYPRGAVHRQKQPRSVIDLEVWQSFAEREKLLIIQTGDPNSDIEMIARATQAEEAWAKAQKNDCCVVTAVRQ